MPERIREVSFALDSPRSGTIDVDLRFPERDGTPLPLVVFCHGFKGFKDWGPFPLWSRTLARAGFASILFNFSYNGVAAEAPTEFTQLDEFEQNTFTHELDDLAAVIGAAEGGHLPGPALDVGGEGGGRLGLMGHSRGGGTAILHAGRDERVQALATWSAVSSFIDRFGDEQISDWEGQGYTEVTNSRTGQTMRLGRALYDDALAHREQLDILDAAGRVQQPWLIVHATEDESVPFTEAQALYEAAPNATFEEVSGGHTFGGTHPFDGDHMDDVPAPVRRVWKRTLRFFDETLRTHA